MKCIIYLVSHCNYYFSTLCFFFLTHIASVQSQVLNLGEVACSSMFVVAELKVEVGVPAFIHFAPMKLLEFRLASPCSEIRFS